MQEKNKIFTIEMLKNNIDNSDNAVLQIEAKLFELEMKVSQEQKARTSIVSQNEKQLVVGLFF